MLLTSIMSREQLKNKREQNYSLLANSILLQTRKAQENDEVNPTIRPLSCHGILIFSTPLCQLKLFDPIFLHQVGMRDKNNRGNNSRFFLSFCYILRKYL